MRLITFIFLLIAPSFVAAELFFSGIDKEKLSKIMTDGKVIWDYQEDGETYRLISHKKTIYLCYVLELRDQKHFQILCKDM